jgi:hypothetical protein
MRSEAIRLIPNITEIHDVASYGVCKRETAIGSVLALELAPGRRLGQAREPGANSSGENDIGLRRGARLLLDLVGGIRPRPTRYLQADTVGMLELNGEYGRRAELNGVELAHTGGTEWFLSPGLMWTKRNFAIKAGVQLPIASDLNGSQEESDFRAKSVLEWHF